MDVNINTPSQHISLISADADKPYPPNNVRVDKNTSKGVYFQYDIHWQQPRKGFSVTNYTVETLSMRDATAASYCSCVGRTSDVTNLVFAFWAGCPGPEIRRDYSLYYRVAANTRDSQSEFISGEPAAIRLGINL